ncbi:hypothetical protein MGN70_002336 [Eutypa lata]|uniref:Putative integral membrane protein n=1 Tax=Eutypa lata (strain UCR-EL1) TaxID=1287681 RepID=M7SZT9_EUTLA|nr:putative integral membrane protein [Eutypa lata UCREL1]KAI1256174.1 hypothetical protein MGN70_002336 [Eutypa lata]
MSDHTWSTITTAVPGLGLALVRLAPLMISSASLMCAWDQQNAFRSFLAPSILSKPQHMSANIVVDWFGEFAKPTKWVINLAYPLGLIFGLINALGDNGLQPPARALFAIGGLLSIFHFWFARWSMMWNARITKKENIGKANEDGLRGWLGNNGARMKWVNFPAWICFVLASAMLIPV